MTTAPAATEATGAVKRFIDAFARADSAALDSAVTADFVGHSPLAFVNNPLPATGKTVSVSQIHVFRVSGGKIVEAWGTRDDLGLMKQLGVLPAPHR